MGCKMQLCWTVLPQGFKSSPTIFGNVLEKELEQWQGKKSTTTLLQYVDDILLGADTAEECKETPIDLLNFLGFSGYRVSQKKAQIMQKNGIYLGFEISQGEKKLGVERKDVICQITPSPPIKKRTQGISENGQMVSHVDT